MTALVWYLVDAAFAAGWVVAALCLFRVLARRCMPRWLAAAMWVLVAVRLLCPLSFESDMSIMPEPLSQTVQTYVAQQTPTSHPHAFENKTPAKSESDTSAVPWETVAGVVWLIGVATMLGYMTVSYVLLRRRVRLATKRDGNVYECEAVESPFILGVFAPRIYVPYRLSDIELENTLAHERAHIARGDHVWKPLAFFLMSVYWFQPLLWLAYHLFCRDIEFACDEKVIKRLSQDERKAYSRALLTAAVGHRRVTMCPLAFGEIGVEARVKGIKRYRKPALVLVALVSVASLVVAGWLMTDPPASSRSTLSDSYVEISFVHANRRQTETLLVTRGNRVTFRSDDGNPLQLEIADVDIEEMQVALTTSKPLYDQNVAQPSVTIKMNEPQTLYTQADGQGARVELALILPSSVVMASERKESKTVLLTGGAELTLFDSYFCLRFEDENASEVYGTYEQTDSTLTLTQDAQLAQWVFRKKAEGVWRFDKAASYRHKNATAPAMRRGATLTVQYAYIIEKSNQLFLYSVTNGKGEELHSGYSKAVKPIIEAKSAQLLSITVEAPASAPVTHRYLLDLKTGDVKEDAT